MTMNTIVKGIGTAMAIGGTIAAVGSAMTGKSAAKRKIRKTAAKAVKTVNSMLDGMSGMLG